MLEAKPCKNPRYLWESFAKEIGIEAIKINYGKYWVRNPIFEEKVFEFWEEDNLIGWTALRPDPIDPVIWQISGVFPEATGHSYVRKIFRWCIDNVFELWPEAEAMFYSISKENKFLDWNLNWIKEGRTKAKVVGEINFPEPGYVIFMIRKERITNIEKELEILREKNK